MRAARLLNTLLMLEARERVTARQLAEAFEVSVRTIHRDIEALSSAGVPVYAERGMGGGFSLAAGRRFQPSGITPDEAAAFPLMGMPTVAAELGIGEDAWSAALKVDAALPPDLRALSQPLARHVHVDLGAAEGAGAPTQLLRGLLDTATRRRVISVRSVNSDGRRTVTEMDPLGLVRSGGHWYLVGRRSRAMTALPVASIELARATGAVFPRPRSFDLRSWWARNA